MARTETNFGRETQTLFSLERVSKKKESFLTQCNYPASNLEKILTFSIMSHIVYVTICLKYHKLNNMLKSLENTRACRAYLWQEESRVHFTHECVKGNQISLGSLYCESKLSKSEPAENSKRTQTVRLYVCACIKEWIDILRFVK
jgi:hypothetical protein